MSIPMSDSVLAAIIAGTATLSASLLQLRSALLREAARGQSASRRKNRVQTILLVIVVGAAAVAGFALSQWLASGERLAQRTLQQEVQARFAEKYSQSTPEGATQQVCQVFTHWSAEHARSVRMLVRYSL